LVYIVDQEGLFAISAQTGKLLWKKSIPNLCSPVRVHAGRVYVPAGSELYVLWDNTGETDWSLKMDSDFINSQCVLDGDRIYLRTWEGLRVCSAETGELQWEFRSSGGCSFPGTQDIIVGETTVYFYPYPLYALDKATGKVKWGMEGCHAAGIETRGILYLYGNSGVLYAFDLAQIDKLRAEGKQWWTLR
jgi:outer membrane protein assembly factor BamB